MIEIIQSILNDAPLKRLGKSLLGNGQQYRSPLEVFTGQPATRPLLRACPPTEFNNAPSIDEVRLFQEFQMDRLQKSISEMHKDVKLRIDAERKRQVNSHNSKANVKNVNFSQGEFVLIRKGKALGHKLASK